MNVTTCSLASKTSLIQKLKYLWYKSENNREAYAYEFTKNINTVMVDQ